MGSQQNQLGLQQSKNSPYVSWMGLNYSSVAKHFPESGRLGKATAEKSNLVLDLQNKQSQTNQMAKLNQPASRRKSIAFPPEHTIFTTIWSAKCIVTKLAAFLYDFIEEISTLWYWSNWMATQFW